MGSNICGLVGVIGDIWSKEKKVFDFLLKLDIVRGPHSTGVARITMENEVQLVKDVGNTWDLLRNKPEEYYNRDKNFGELNGNFKALMGHNRWATVGDITAQNAHPFVQGSVVGAHNGTLDNYAHHYRLEDSEKFDTDSECIMHNINVFGAEKTVGKLSGAWALTWHDSHDDTFNIVRNKERPLHYAWDKRGKVFYYASEDWMLDAAFNRYEVEVEDIYILAADTHYKFDMTGRIIDFSKDQLTRSILKGWQAPKYVPQHQYGTNVSPFPRARNHSDRELALEMEKKIGHYVDFCVANLREDENQQKYVSGYIWNRPDIEVRIYTKPDTDLYALLDDGAIEEYYGKVKKVKTTPQGVYITLWNETIGHIDWNNNSFNMNNSNAVITADTITTALDDEIPFDDASVEDGDDYIVGFAREEVSKEEYETQVKHGCAWCSIVPPVEDCHDLKWIDRQTFVCADCSEDQYVLANIAAN